MFFTFFSCISFVFGACSCSFPFSSVPASVPVFFTSVSFLFHRLCRLADFSLVSVSLPRFLLCFSWLYRSLTGCLRFSAGFPGLCSWSVNGFHRCHQEFHCKFPWLLLLAALFDGLRPLILFMRDLFALTRALFSFFFLPTKTDSVQQKMHGDCVYGSHVTKCMDIVFKDVILLQNGVIHCKLYRSSR